MSTQRRNLDDPFYFHLNLTSISIERLYRSEQSVANKFVEESKTRGRKNYISEIF